MNILCFSYFAGIFGLLQRFINRDKIRYHGASAFPGGSRLPHGTVPVCSKHRTGTARHSHCGGSYPSFHPLSWGNEVGFSLSANKANAKPLATR